MRLLTKVGQPHFFAIHLQNRNLNTLFCSGNSNSVKWKMFKKSNFSKVLLMIRAENALIL